jgi:hypothetical protein
MQGTILPTHGRASLLALMLVWQHRKERAFRSLLSDLPTSIMIFNNF